MGSVGLLRGKRKIEETAKGPAGPLRKALLSVSNVRQSKELTERIERRLLEEEPDPESNSKRMQ